MRIILTYPHCPFNNVSENDGKSPVRDIMKILIIIILCLIALVVGCSDCCDPGLSLWEKRRMDDDQRIYGNPYESYRYEEIGRHRE